MRMEMFESMSSPRLMLYYLRGN
ncbi:hypothetical protein F383_16487 [Gossypium arboreum]|uniref:Uncharacterized protein n=1 Tax=Gossypium arboreum TaxID=29729 RepID=A0A0B0PUA5_GOSAR|nr:hypothetical protein F383_16487 [Gossypium arboreum]